MKKKIVRVGVVLAICAGMGLSSCIGSFSLSNRLLAWNKTIGNKFVNELVFVAFWILPVYEVSWLADFFVINSIEFWSGDNPMACGTKRIESPDGQRYLVKCDGKGYDITGESDGLTVRLDFDSETQRWDVELPSGSRYELMTFVDSDHVTLPAADGQRLTVTLDEQGLMAYQASVNAPLFAAR